MIKNINEIVESRRKELRFRDTEIAELIGLNVSWYCDIEWHEDELKTTVYLGIVKKLFKFLKLDFFEMVELKCAFCELDEEFERDYQLPRNELIKRRRKNLSLTRDELGEKVGFYEIVVENMENEPDFLEKWVILNILRLAKMLSVPPQILFDVKCKKCHR